jgi:hypothetical protein
MQFTLVKPSPFRHKCKDTWRQRSSQHHGRLNADLGHGSAVHRVKMRGTVVEEVHSYHDAQEARDFWHTAKAARARDMSVTKASPL